MSAVSPVSSFSLRNSPSAATIDYLSRRAIDIMSPLRFRLCMDVPFIPDIVSASRRPFSSLLYQPPQPIRHCVHNTAPASLAAVAGPKTAGGDTGATAQALAGLCSGAPSRRSGQACSAENRRWHTGATAARRKVIAGTRGATVRRLTDDGCDTLQTVTGRVARPSGSC